MATLRQQIATNVLSVTRFRDLLRKVKSYRPPEDQALVKKAYEFSEQHHKGQVRQSGCLLYTSPSPRDYAASRMPSSA